MLFPGLSDVQGSPCLVPELESPNGSPWRFTLQVTTRGMEPPILFLSWPLRALASGAVSRGLEGVSAGTMAGTAGSHLVLLDLVRWLKADGRFGVLRENSRVASLAIVFFVFDMSGVVEGNISVLGSQDQLQRRLLVLREQRGQTGHGNKKKTRD